MPHIKLNQGLRRIEVVKIEIDNNLSSDPNLNNVYRSPTISAIENKSSVFKEFTLSYLYSNNLIYYGTSIKRNVIQISNTSNVSFVISFG